MLYFTVGQLYFTVKYWNDSNFHLGNTVSILTQQFVQQSNLFFQPFQQFLKSQNRRESFWLFDIRKTTSEPGQTLVSS